MIACSLCAESALVASHIFYASPYIAYWGKRVGEKLGLSRKRLKYPGKSSSKEWIKYVPVKKEDNLALLKSNAPNTSLRVMVSSSRHPSRSMNPEVITR